MHYPETPKVSLGPLSRFGICVFQVGLQKQACGERLGMASRFWDLDLIQKNYEKPVIFGLC